MATSDEHSRLLDGVRRWFEQRDQVEHYAQDVAVGFTQAESWLFQSVHSHESVLDLGCAAGRVAVALAQRGCRVVAVDISAALLRVARDVTQSRGCIANYVLVEALDLPFADSSFETVIATKVYCYIPTRILRLKYLEQIKRVLRPGGKLLMTQYITPEQDIGYAYDETFRQIAPNYTVLEPGDTFTIGETGGSYVHWFTARELDDELRQSGLSLMSFHDDRAFGGAGYLALMSLRKATP
ncbi:MAG: class I SAM-dependent methyltransferase [Chloroflexi bacterium]|nr:class I SAM-dependent methyltransferase [Chloroflexota bacterium]